VELAREDHMTDKIIVTPAMVREAYNSQVGSGSRITNVTADYIAKGLTAALNPPMWEPYALPFTDEWGVKGPFRIRFWDGVGERMSPSGTKVLAQRLAAVLNKVEFDV
jgi:hypothetical protein